VLIRVPLPSSEGGGDPGVLGEAPPVDSGVVGANGSSTPPIAGRDRAAALRTE
jgi:hypothetical protein